MNRRDFIKAALGSAYGSLYLSGLACTNSSSSPADASSPPDACDVDDASSTGDAPGAADAGGADAAPGNALERIGVQLYTVRTLLADDFDGTLQRIAEIGYDEVEFAGYFGNSAADIKSKLDTLGLKAPSAHASLDDLRSKIGELLEFATTIGHDYLVCAYLAPEEREDIDAYKSLADEFNQFGETCKAAGVRFGFHNHDFEFAEMGGQIPYDVLLADTQADLVCMQMDLYWVSKAGVDPFSYFSNHAGRFPLCHVKDMDESGDFADVGAGTIDFAKIFAQSAKAGFMNYFVEHDQPQNPEQTIERSYQYLRDLRF